MRKVNKTIKIDHLREIEERQSSAAADVFLSRNIDISGHESERKENGMVVHIYLMYQHIKIFDLWELNPPRSSVLQVESEKGLYTAT